jgi:mRNA-degrading endonuclease RelE of RelBE toxin-antitoxin system
VQRQISKAIDALENAPFAGDVIALHGDEWKVWYRKRAGRYRIIFTLNHSENEVNIAVILLRSEKTYR